MRHTAMAETSPSTHSGPAEATNAGRIIGALMLAQMVCAFFVNFVLQSPLFGAPGFLVNAAPHSLQISLSVCCWGSPPVRSF